MKKQIKIAICSLLLGSTLVGQSATRQYGTQAYMAQMSTDEYRANQSGIERRTADFRNYGSMDSSVWLPVIFHLMPLPDGAPAITEADIQAQMNQLNMDFYNPDHPYLNQEYQHPGIILDGSGNITGYESDSQPYRSIADQKEAFATKAASALIRFCFPVSDPQGLPASGIIQVVAEVKVWGMGKELKSTASGGSSAWPSDQYINIWVARLPDSLSGGFAQMPGGPAASDGIVVDDRYFAHANGRKTYNKGRTLSHLMGSYLNLYELWNDSQPCADDYVEDTPIHNAPNNDFPLYDYKHISTCDGNPVEMISNIMDNAPDSVQYLFTHGQAVRMQAVVAEGGPRYTLRATALSCADNKQRELKVNDKAGIAQNPLSNWSMSLSPNPATGRFEIQITALSHSSELSGTIHCMIYGATGNLVWEYQSLLDSGSAHLIPVQIDNWPSGTYAVIATFNGISQSRRIIVK